MGANVDVADVGVADVGIDDPGAFGAIDGPAAAIATRAPQPTQKRAVSRIGVPHWVQNIRPLGVFDPSL